MMVDADLEAPFYSSAGLPSNPLVDEIRKLVIEYIHIKSFKTALFWAEKVTFLSENEPLDVFNLAYCLFCLGRYEEAVIKIKKSGTTPGDIGCRYLMAKCYAKYEQYEDAFKILDNENLDAKVDTDVEMSLVDDTISVDIDLADYYAKHARIRSCMLVLKGDILQKQYGDLNAAVACYKKALRTNIHCYEAFDALCYQYLIAASEVEELVQSLPKPEEDDTDFMRAIYAALLQPLLHCTPGDISDDIENTEESFTDLSPLSLLQHSNTLSFDLLLMTAQLKLINFDFIGCWEITRRIAYIHPYDEKCLSLHIICLTELKKHADIFKFAHNLVRGIPKQPLSWFAIGCYYYCIGKYDCARRYFATSVDTDRTYVPGWIAYGHAFSASKEHDPAIATYFKAYELTRGFRCHLPLLYMGAEAEFTTNPTTTHTFLQKSLSLAPGDPEVLNELAVYYYYSADYEKAEHHLLEALHLIDNLPNALPLERWEPVYNNLGQVSRKLKKYDNAIEYFRKALSIDPLNATLYTNIAIVTFMKGDKLKAIEYLVKSSSMLPDDEVTSSFMEWALQICSTDKKLFPAFYDSSSVMDDEEENSLDFVDAVSDEIHISYDDDDDDNNVDISTCEYRLSDGINSSKIKVQSDDVNMESDKIEDETGCSSTSSSSLSAKMLQGDDSGQSNHKNNSYKCEDNSNVEGDN